MSSQEHFTETFDAWLQAVATQAEDREMLRARDIDSYLKLRSVTIGLLPSFAILGLGMELPKEVLHHPTIKKASLLCAELLSIDQVRLHEQSMPKPAR